MCHKPLLLRGTPFFLLQRGVPLRDVTTIDTVLRSRDLALLGLSPIVSRAHGARQEQGPLDTADLGELAFVKKWKHFLSKALLALGSHTSPA